MKRKILSCVLALALVLAGSVAAFADETAPETDSATPAADTSAADDETTTEDEDGDQTTAEDADQTTSDDGDQTPADETTDDSTTTGTAVTVPSDVAGGQYEAAVKALLEKGVIAGYADGTFRPANSIDRAEACTMVVKMLAPTEEQLNAAKASSFTDMGGDYVWAQTYVNYAVEKGVIAGYSDGTFRPQNQVTYEEMAAMVVNSLGFTANDLTGSWPDNYVNKAKELGIFNDIQASKVGEIAANRGDVASMIWKGTDPEAKDYAKTLLAESLAKSADLKSMAASMSMDAVMSAAGESMNMTMTGDVAFTYEPMAMKMTMDMSVLGESTKVEAYMVEEGDQFMLYMNQDSAWTKTPIAGAEELGDLVNSPATVDMELYLKSVGDVRVEGMDSVNGKPAVKMYCEVSPDYMDEVLKSTGALSVSNADLEGIDEATMLAMFKDLGFSYYLWIDTESGLPVKYDMDLTDMMSQLMKNMADALEVPELATAISIDKMVITMTIDNYGDVEAIALPDAAKNATLVTPEAQ